MYLEGLLVFGETFEVLFGELLTDAFLILGVYDGNAGSLEASATETAAIHSGEGAHDFVDGYELGRTAFVVVDAALATVEAELTEELEVAALPGGDTLTHAAVLAVEVLGTAGKALGHGNAGLLERGLGNVAKEGLVEHLEGLVGIGEHVPGGGLALVHAEVVVAVYQAAGEAGEEDAELELGHIGVPLDDAVLVGVAIEEEEAVLASQGDAGLVEETIVQADIFAFGFGGYLHHFEGGELYLVGLGKGHDVGYKHGGTGGEASYGQGALDAAGDAVLERKALAQGVLGATGIVAPMVLTDDGGLGDIEVYRSLEGL